MESDISNRHTTLGHSVFSGVFSLSRMDPDRDLDLLHRWMNDPEVARFWKKPWPRWRVATYLREQDTSRHSIPYLGRLDGVPMSYWELYRADLDPLAQFYTAHHHDAGIHLLLGPAQCRGRGLAADLIRVVSGWQLDADVQAARVVAEPDMENARSVRAFERAGFQRAGHVDLPGKRALLMVRNREPR